MKKKSASSRKTNGKMPQRAAAAATFTNEKSIIEHNLA